ncbi:MAG: hypothetical protein KKF56_01310 [Nanoarchaeota archaeon]|nr:hypothetical protein [Nanoarchaeota archaeon]
MKKIISLIVMSMFLLNFAVALSVTDVDSSPSEISPGDKVSVILTVDNNLNADAKDVSVMLDLKDVPFAPFQSSSEQLIDEINEGDSEEMEFNLIAFPDSDSGIYKIPVKIIYLIDDEEKTSEGLISLMISADPKIEVSIEDTLLIKGENSNLNIRITNSGLGNAKLLSVRLNPSSGIKIVGLDNVYIGNIDSDDFDSSEFNIFVNENSPSNINFPITIKYRDSQNKEITENKNVVVRAYTQDQAVELGLISKSNTLMVVGVIVFLVLIYILYKSIKKRRKNSEY